MKKHAIIFASLALSCLVLSAPLSAGAVSSSQTEASSLYIITVQPELPVTERSELELTALEMTQTWQNPNPRRQLALKSVSRAGCSVYRWSSSAPVVASVDASGLVTALAPGKAVISAYTTQGETLTCTVAVTSEIGKVTLDADVLLLHSIGSQQDLIPTVAVQELSAPLSAGAVSSSQTEASSLYIITVQPELPVTERSELELTALEMTQTWQNPNPRRQLALKSVSRAGCSVYRWSSSAPVVASVDASGLVTALAPGKAVISAYTTQGETLTCTVAVTSEIGKVTLDADVLLLHSIGSQQDLIPTVAVQEPSAVALQWTSSDPSVAVVDADGTVTAVADGKAIVTVRTPEGRSAGCAVYVGQAAADYEKRDRQLTKAALGGMGILGALFLLLGIAL